MEPNQHYVVCPVCESTSLSAEKNDENETEIICLNCGNNFRPGEGITVFYNPAQIVESRNKTTIYAGYAFAILSVFFFPLPFAIIGIILGIFSIGKNIADGIAIIVLSCICGCIGVMWGINAMTGVKFFQF